MSNSLTAFCRRIGHTFGDPTLLELAMTHRSYGGRNNERLEFLGDSIVNFVIAEALIATAIGLFAAIPAVIAYNRFAARGEMLIGRYYTFADEFQAILHRKVHTTED